jgi:hypothetical protein
MKYLRKFATEAEVDVDASPNVVLVADSGEIIYNVPMYENGVYIQHINGRLYTNDEWSAKGFANEVANGVAIIDDKCSFVVSKKWIANNIRWTEGYSATINGILSTDDEAIAKTDFLGASNTDLVIKKASENSGTAPAPLACQQYSFPNGKKGYMGAVGEWSAIIKYSNKVTEAMALLGNTSIVSTNFQNWTSTQGVGKNVWVVLWDSSKSQFYLSKAYRDQNYNKMVYAFTTL